jgi:hypothetical protein
MFVTCIACSFFVTGVMGYSGNNASGHRLPASNDRKQLLVEKCISKYV